MTDNRLTHDKSQSIDPQQQVICERLCAFAGEILEYCGTLHLELPSQVIQRERSHADPKRFNLSIRPTIYPT